MKIVRMIAGGPCGGGLDCPTVYELEDGGILIQGTKPTWRQRISLRRRLGRTPRAEVLSYLPAAVAQELRGS